ncbi:MAG TPA: hypothetical protein VHN77_05235 [Phycisphaerales bacterium]|nr:hypothetical protein [Phycisphaerales bacterium]
MPDVLSIPHTNPQPPCFQAESVAPSPLHLLTPSPAHFLPPETTARLLTTALSALEEVAKASPNPVERRRAATTILRYLFVPAPRAPRADKVPQGAGPPASCGDRARSTQATRTPTRAAHAGPLSPAPTPVPVPPQPLPQTLSAPAQQSSPPPPLHRAHATLSPAATLLAALTASHDIARQRLTTYPNAPPPPRFSPLFTSVLSVPPW